jgi:glycosidase
MAYASDEHTLHIRLQVAKHEASSVELIVGDPFEWRLENGTYVWSGKALAHQMMTIESETALFDYWFASVHTESTRSKYAFLIRSENKTWFYGCRDLAQVDPTRDEKTVYDLFGYFNYPYINREDLMDSPAWADDVVWYQIFPDRFHKSAYQKDGFLPFGSVEAGIRNDMFFGGDLQGVIEKIPYLRDLGITGIYFTPIFKAYSAHKYDTEDYFRVDPAFGTNADLKELVSRCHENGIKVMLDAVFNHCGWEHPFFQDVIKNGRTSPYWDCFFIEDDRFIDFPLDASGRPAVRNIKPKYRTFALSPVMPKLNTGNPLMEKYLLDVATYWIRECDIDGWRLDVSNEVSHAFWRKFRQAVRSVKDDVYILGENWDSSSPWLQGDQMDAVMNYELSYHIWQYFGVRGIPAKIDAERFAYRINALLQSYPRTVSKNMFNLIDSHDTMRILTRCGGNSALVKLAYLFVFTFCGSPAILYGDEIGLEGDNEPDSRRCMIWDVRRQDTSLYEFIRKMISLRKSTADMKRTEILWHLHDDGVLVYQKGSLVVAMNANSDSRRVPVPSSLKSKPAVDLENGRPLALGDFVSLSGFGYVLYELSE